MKTRRRFIQSVISAAKANEAEMPWARGKRRMEFVTKRQTKVAATRRMA